MFTKKSWQIFFYSEQTFNIEQNQKREHKKATIKEIHKEEKKGRTQERTFREAQERKIRQKDQKVEKKKDKSEEGHTEGK